SAGATRLTTCRSRLFPLSPPFHILPLPTFRRRMNLPGNAASMSEPLYFVGVDVGGTTIKGGVMDDTGRALSAVSLATEASKGQAHGLEQMCETVRQAAAAAGLRREQVAAIGVATPGTMDIPAGVILDPPNLRPWQNVPVRRHIQETFGVPTAFQNDANAAAYGEYWIGAGRGARSMVFFTLGTGVGCGIIIDDTIIEG